MTTASLSVIKIDTDGDGSPDTALNGIVSRYG